MNKLAADKVASEYYNLGVQFAMQQAGLTKTAKMRPIDKRALGIMGKIGLGGAAGVGLGHVLNKLEKRINDVNLAKLQASLDLDANKLDQALRQQREMFDRNLADYFAGLKNKSLSAAEDVTEELPSLFGH